MDIICVVTPCLTPCDEDGNIMKRVTSADSNDVEEPEGEGTGSGSDVGTGGFKTGN